MASPKVSKDNFFQKVINPYLAGVLQHPQSIKMHEGVLHIRDVEGPKNIGSLEARLEAMEKQVFKCQGMVERGLNANHMIITEFTNKHKIDPNDIGKHLSSLYDRIDHLQAQIYDLQNQNGEVPKIPIKNMKISMMEASRAPKALVPTIPIKEKINLKLVMHRIMSLIHLTPPRMLKIKSKLKIKTKFQIKSKLKIKTKFQIKSKHERSRANSKRR
ncbi:40s ribosomal protein s5-1 [Hordeum vulgare]|nr:40s ribosomal protein s5-1 [Hordeum vulgare]